MSSKKNDESGSKEKKRKADDGDKDEQPKEPKEPKKEKVREEKTKKDDSKRKESNHNDKHSDDETEGKDKSTKDGKQNPFDSGLDPDKIIGATDINGELAFLVQWKNSNKAMLIPSKLCRVKCPQLVIDFYEQRLAWHTE